MDFIRILWIISQIIFLNWTVVGSAPNSKEHLLYVYIGSRHLLIESMLKNWKRTHTQKIKYENEQLNDIFVSFECKVVVVWHEGKPKIKTKIKPTNFTELIWRTCFELNIYYEFISIFNVLWLLNRPLGKIFFPSASFSIITTLILFLCFWWSSVWDNGFWIWLPLARIHFSRRTYWNKSPITVWCVSVWIIRNKQHFLQCGTVCSSCFSVCFFSLRRNIYLKCENEYGPITGIYKPNANDIWRDWR